MAHERGEPIYNTLDGEGGLVLMDIDAFEQRDAAIRERVKAEMQGDNNRHTMSEISDCQQIISGEVSEYSLGQQLREMYETAPKDDRVTMIHLFAIINSELLQNKRLSKREILKSAGMKESYQAEISKGVRLARYVKIKDEYSNIANGQYSAI